jgi:hypothetical protein
MTGKTGYAIRRAAWAGQVVAIWALVVVTMSMVAALMARF